MKVPTDHPYRSTAPLTATAAREISNRANDKIEAALDIAPALDRIRSAAEVGRFSVGLRMERGLINRLQKLGFKCRDTAGGDISVEW